VRFALFATADAWRLAQAKDEASGKQAIALVLWRERWRRQL